MIKGITTVLDHKKWLFAYVITGLAFWQLDATGIVQVLTVLIPVTIGASSFDKSKWRET